MTCKYCKSNENINVFSFENGKSYKLIKCQNCSKIIKKQPLYYADDGSLIARVDKHKKVNYVYDLSGEQRIKAVKTKKPINQKSKSDKRKGGR